MSDRSQLLPHSQTGLDLQDQQLLNNQNQNCGGGVGSGGGGGDGRCNVPNIILTGQQVPPSFHCTHIQSIHLKRFIEMPLVQQFDARLTAHTSPSSLAEGPHCNVWRAA